MTPLVEAKTIQQTSTLVDIAQGPYTNFSIGPKRKAVMHEPRRR